MSVYQQVQGYGHAPYPPQSGYSQAPPPVPYPAHQPPYHVPNPPPMFFMDPNTFRRDYAARLSELTFNSRPIIQNLSMIAQEYVRYADIVAQCLEAHIRRVPPWMKLPAFYVLDAISKNVFDPYASRFSPFVVSLFLDSYNQVDPSIRSKMDEMLVTWRTGAPTGKELFGVAVQVSIERSIWGNDATSVDGVSRRHGHNSPSITKSQVLAELEVTLAQKQRASQMNPYDGIARNQIGILEQLRRMVEVGVSQEELAQILQQLRAMSKDTSATAPPPPAPQYMSPVPPVQLPFNAPPAIPTSYPGYSQTPFSQGTVIPPVASTSSAASSSIEQLFQSLVKAGLVPPSTTSTLESEKPVSIEQSETTSDQSNEEARTYAKSIKSMKIKLSTADIIKQRPVNVDALYERLPLQCKQCAMRFPDGSSGKKRMEDHLDMHFRQNRRAAQATGRGYSRSWFISIDDWINDHSEGKGKGRDISYKGTSTSVNADVDEKALRESFVVVPPGDEVKSISCPVCKETLKSEFRDEDEEWVWTNAVRVKDKIYHATCHAEMITSSSLSAKLRGESSRGVTPEITDSGRSTPPLKAALTASMKAKLRSSKSPTPDNVVPNLKRKAESDSDEAAVEKLIETPPFKKVVLEASS